MSRRPVLSLLLLATATAALAQSPLPLRDPPAVREPATAARPTMRAPTVAPALLQLETRLRRVLPPAAAGGFTVSTRPGESSRAAQTWQAGPADEALPALPVLRVRSGASTSLDLGRWQRREAVDWVWTPQGAGVTGGARYEALRTRLQLQPVWSGGPAPVDLQWALSLPGRTADGPPETLDLQGRLDVALDEWTELARWPDPADPRAPGWRLDLRVSRLPAAGR